MKKTIALTMTLMLCLSLCSCKSKEAKAVDELILAIGTVNSESLDPIVSAKQSYENLSESDKEDVEQYDVLLAAEAEFAEQIIETGTNALNNGKVKYTELLYSSYLNDRQIRFSDEQRASMEETLELIKKMCYMGTYLIMPEYIIDQQIKIIGANAATVGDLYTQDSLFVSYEFSSEGSFALAFEQYIGYLDQFFTCFDYERDGGREVYHYTDDQGHQFDIIVLSEYKEFFVDIYRDFFDWDKMDMSDSEMTIRWTTEGFIVNNNFIWG